MTRLASGKTVTRITKATVQHKPLVVTLYADVFEIRRLGSRGEHFLIPYETIYRDAAMRQAERDRAISKRTQR